METGGTPEDSGHHEADNVIRFPRDWFGSKDDLIPIGPAADRLEEAAAAAEREAAERDDPYALSADDFWGEGSGALHQPVDIPREAEAAGSPLRVVAPLETAPEPVLMARPRRPRLPFVLSLPRVGVPQFGVPRSVLVLVAMLIAALALFVSGELKTSAPRATRVASRQATTPADLAQLMQVQNHRDQPTSVGAGAAQSPGKARAVKTHRAVTGRHVVRKADRSKAARHRAKVTTHRSVTPAPARDTAAVSSASTDSVATQPEQSTATEITPSASEGVSEPQQSTASAADSSSAGSSAAASGPTGLGGAVGSQCNPKCSG